MTTSAKSVERFENRGGSARLRFVAPRAARLRAFGRAPTPDLSSTTPFPGSFSRFGLTGTVYLIPELCRPNLVCSRRIMELGILSPAPAGERDSVYDTPTWGGTLAKKALPDFHKVLEIFSLPC